MIGDLHAHYAMHLVPKANRGLCRLLRTPRGQARLRDRLRALLVGLASRFANYRSLFSGPRVEMESLKAGDVRVVLSVLYSFFDELELSEPYPAAPKPSYLPTLVRQLELVERDISENHAEDAVVAHDYAQLESAVNAGKVALVHCVEGGFHLGPTPREAERAVAKLAERGVAYMILAHLVWRRVATNAPALPFLPDWLYRLLFRQPEEGLSELGATAARACIENGVLLDLSHMSERSLADAFELLDRLDPARRVPVIASHACYRFGSQEYGLSEETVRKIGERDGAVGLIMAQHQLRDGVRRLPTLRFKSSFNVICTHIDRIAEITGSHRHAAIGSDFDGFIKPTMGGLQSMADMGKLEAALRDHYDEEDAEAICSGNAMRVLRAGWRGAG